MIACFEDFCLYVYVIVDDIWQQIAPGFRRPGPRPHSCSDSELLAMALIGECQGWDRETELLAHFHRFRHLFPRLPSQSRFNRRRRQLMDALKLIRQVLLAQLDLAQDRHCALDSLPVPVVAFHRAPQARSDWAEHGAAYGRVSSKQQTIYGYKLHLLVTLSGVIKDFTLAPANVLDLPVGAEMLAEHTALVVVGDKAYISAPVAQTLWTERGIRLLTKPRKNQRRQLPEPIRRLYNRVRQVVEAVTSQLVAQFAIETNLAHSLWGLCTRLWTKLVAHTLCLHINRLLGVPDVLQIKRLAFPN